MGISDVLLGIPYCLQPIVGYWMDLPHLQSLLGIGWILPILVDLIDNHHALFVAGLHLEIVSIDVSIPNG